MSDLTPDELAQFIAAAERAGGTVTDDTVIVRSHVWPGRDSQYRWELEPGGDHGLRVGDATSVDACHQAMAEVLVEIYGEEVREQAMTIVRMVP